MSDPIKLTWQDHVLIHACGALLADRWRHDHDDMILSILSDVLPDVTPDNPSLTPFVAVAREFCGMPPESMDAARHRRASVLYDYHLRRMALAWGNIQEQYSHDDVTSETAGGAGA